MSNPGCFHRRFIVHRLRVKQSRRPERRPSIPFHRELFIANGHVYPAVDDAAAGSYAQYNQLFENTGRGFSLVADAGRGILVRRGSRGTTFGDFDNDGDGDIDLFVAELDAELTLLRNDTARNGHSMIIKTIGVTSNRDGVGTRIAVRTG